MLMMGFTLEVFDSIGAEDIEDTLPALGLGIVREEAVGYTMVADQVFKGLGGGRFRGHGVDNSLGTALANIELSHGSPTMAMDAMIMSRSVTEEGVSCNTFISSMEVVGREAGLIFFAWVGAQRPKQTGW
jgi:hypothetical protein